ncbi:prepilin-type N-terminal cleavage/methylation domain-containing protein [Planococcus shenhongbingii]|uniref:prepilin-type N-terminal cleavage/methylation domain-containing protein n=1 Tax=Planococcus shenhongbingii TaxID=3058398 RepID=UPI00263A095E|nr:prepilin-type N-terminal cleavage/methylation domain-containing protein [Planococcus sp. N016]WKA60007.1 prepilin-type N-terminal cleavage/methylation domain-containing protein [Planococcus sp. N016]
MKKYLQKKLKNEKGMTLIELLAVIVIIAIIAAIAIPAIGGIIDNSRVGAIKSDATNALSAAELYKLDIPATTGSVTVQQLLDAKYLDSAGKLPPAAVITFGTSSALNTIKTATPAIDGKIEVTFNEATKKHIADYANSTRDNTTGTVVATKK